MAAKKTAAKPEKPDSPLGEFPLPDGDYFHPQVVSRRAHWGEDERDKAHLRLVQEFLGVSATGTYDEATGNAVLGWKADHDLLPSLVIDAQTWQQMRDN